MAAPAAASALPGAPAPDRIAHLACTVDVRAGSLRCADIGPAALGSVGLDAGLGAYAPVSGTWASTVVLRNGSADVLGSRDGVTADPDGIAVRLLDAPTVTQGRGAVRLLAGSDLALHVPGLLAPGAASAPADWRFSVPASVEAFTFRVGVFAAVAPLPRGWVTLASTATSAFPGGSYGITATARSARGVALPTGAITWSTSDASLVSVDAAGAVTPVEPGLATITARRGASTASIDVAVCPSLAVGQVHHLTVSGTAGFCLSGAAGAAAEYTIIPVNESTGSSPTSMTITGTGIQPVTGPPNPAAHEHDGIELPDGLRLGGEVASDAHLTDEGVAAQEALNRELERLLPDPRTRVSTTSARARRFGTRAISPGTRRPGDRSTPGDRRSALAQPIPYGVVPAIGDTMYLNVAAGCSGATDIRKGVVRAVTSNFIFVFDKDNPAFTPTSTGGYFMPDTLAARYERYGVHDEMASTFGAPTDVDGNGRSVVFYTRAVNELSPPASSTVVLGYFTARDLFSSDPSSCPRSNEGEIFYMLVPDPTGAVNSNVRTESYVMGNTFGTAAHEMQHLINASRRVYIAGVSTFEEVWLNEALSSIGEERMFYRHSVGLAPGGNIVVSQLTTGPNASRRVAAFNTYANNNYGRLRSFLQRPDTTGVFRLHDGLAVRGGGWGFLRYAIDRKGGAQAATTLALSGNATATGKETLRQALGLATTAEVDAWYRDWLVSMYADDAVSGVATEYTNPSWNYRSLFTALNGSYQLIPRNLANGTPLTLSYKSRGASAFVRVGVAADGFARITGASGGSAPPSTMRLSVIRTK